MSETPKLAVSRSSARTFTGWTIVFFVVLRIAIGWHFLYEGAWKLVKEKDWKATPYLLTSAGPMRETFRWMIDDPDGLVRLTPERAKARIDKRCELLTKFYKLNDTQKADVKAFADRKKVGDPANAPQDNVSVDAVFADANFQLQLADYKKLLEEIRPHEKAVHYPSQRGTDFNRERVVFDYGKKSKALAGLLAQVEKPMKDLEAMVTGQLDEKQLALGAAPYEDSQTELIDWMNMISLTLVGVCLMLGLFTRLAAVGGIGLLAMYYFAMPPWPGLPDTPMSEGHYLIVNKNVVEAIALMVIATSRIGRWGGIDGIIAAIFCRNKACQEDVNVSEPAAEARQTQYV